MTKAGQEGKKPSTNGKKKLKKQRILRLALILFAIFIFISAIAGFATYRVVSAYMADLPDFDYGKFVPSATSFVYDKDGNEITPLMAEQNRIILSLDEISQHIIDAFIAIEDDRFYEHTGFDLRGILRAAYNNTFNKSTSMQGGSTITQQLVKNTFYDPSDRSIKRKVQELYLSYQIERIFTKEEILEYYLNRIFFDHNAYGVETASQTYFGKRAADVTLAEAAILAGIPNLPRKYSPYRNMEEAKNRQALVLSRMVDLEMITAEEAREARNEEIVLAGLPEQEHYPYPFFTDYVVQNEAPDLLARLPEYQGLTKQEIFKIIYEGGLQIHTTLDPELQQIVVDTINDDSLYPPSLNDIQGQAAAILVQPKTGYISAMVGGRDYINDKHDRVVLATNQAGSVIKPIVAYAPAFHEGIASTGTVLDDAPAIFSPHGGGPAWYPNNYDSRFRGLVTVRYALAYSLNLPAAHLLDQLGVEKAKEYAEKMGITSLDEKDDLGMVAGGLTNGVSVYDTAQAFAVLANEGVRANLTTITKIVDREGKIIYEHLPNGEEVISSGAAWLTTSALQDAVRRGTANKLRIGRPVAAKTGTSNLARDAWMAAYTPDYVGVFWIGRDSWPDEKDTWGNFRSFEVVHKFMNPIMKAAHEGLPVSEFTRPDTIRGPVSICSKSGLRPGENCPDEHITSDYFPRNLIPGDTCEMHVELEVCEVSGLLAGEFCPEELRIPSIFLNRPEFILTDSRWSRGSGRGPADAELMPPEDTCDQHTSRPDDLSELKATVKDDGTVSLSWKAAEGASGYFVYRDGSQLTENAIKDTTYADMNLAPGTYKYQVEAINSEGVKSNLVSVSITVEPPPPEPEPEPEPEPDPPPQDGNGNDKKNNDNNG
ncbi:MAG: PBP1A family penicillin-binding protein [Bacillota bacterium]|nr:PBP1A family penicillin-binding protein [Bacillota bacterium]MDW7684950.1 PBP1A family penicillin-binding protein [Bacillota bacterium]